MRCGRRAGGLNSFPVPSARLNQSRATRLRGRPQPCSKRPGDRHGLQGCRAGPQPEPRCPRSRAGHRDDSEGRAAGDAPFTAGPGWTFPSARAGNEPRRPAAAASPAGRFPGPERGPAPVPRRCPGCRPCPGGGAVSLRRAGRAGAVAAGRHDRPAGRGGTGRGGAAAGTALGPSPRPPSAPPPPAAGSVGAGLAEQP